MLQLLMQSKFIDYIRKNNLVQVDESILLGISGGIDSMVMLNLFIKSGYKIAIAHCNFGLRSSESVGDEELVIRTAEKFGLKYFSKRFETEKYSFDNKVSIQVAARNLRYNWFNHLCQEFGYSKIAIAHNLDDVAETFLLNLTRGTGLKGLTGIKPLNGKIIRPLLFTTRKEIESYALEHQVIFRSDSSNKSTKYKRNFIRHKILPELEKLNPSVKESIALTANHLHAYFQLFEKNHCLLREKIVSDKNENTYYSIKELSQDSAGEIFLFEELQQYGFAPLQMVQIMQSLSHQPGKVFHSKEYVLTRDREYLILSRKGIEEHVDITIEIDCSSVEFPIKLEFKTIEKGKEFEISKNAGMAKIDFDKLKFPLTLRNWHEGDRFKPIGMDNYKKLSDFIIDEKIPLNQKKDIYVITSGNEIVWVVGYRISNDFRITTETKIVYQVLI